jgi:hypothetical protein
VLPCIVKDFILNNQPDSPIIQIYSVLKLHVSGIFSAHHQEFSTLHPALVSFMQVLMAASKQSQDGKLYMFRASSLPIIWSFL